MRRVKTNIKKTGIGEIGVLYSDNVGASWVNAVPAKAPTKILFQGKSIVNDNTLKGQINRTYVHALRLSTTIARLLSYMCTSTSRCSLQLQIIGVALTQIGAKLRLPRQAGNPSASTSS